MKPKILSYKIAEFAFNLVNQGKGEVSGWHGFSGKAEWLDKVKPLSDDIEFTIHQTRQEVAREILREIRNYASRPVPIGVQFLAMPVEYLDFLESKYLQEGKCKG